MPTCLRPHLTTYVMMSFECAKIDRGGVGGGSGGGVGVGSACARENGKHVDAID